MLSHLKNFTPLFLICLCINVGVCSDNLKIISAERMYDSIGSFATYYAETNQPLSLSEAIAIHQKGQFVPWGKPVISLGIGNQPHWISFTINNPTQAHLQRRLIIENSWIDLIDLYVINHGEIISKQQAGDQFPFSSRPIKHRFFAFDHDYSSGLTQIFMRVETPDPMVLPIFFGSLEESAARDVFNGYSYGLLYGMIISLLLYNAILYFNLRMERYLFYVIYLSMFLLMNFAYTGHGFSTLWPENIWWQRWLNPGSIFLYAISGFNFTLSFLRTRKLFPHIYSQIINFCIGLSIVQVLLLLLNVQAASVMTAITFVIIFSFFSLIMATLSLKLGHRDIKYFLIASIATALGATITAITTLGIIPYSTLTFRAVEIGIAIDAIVLSIALAEQFRMTQNEKLQAERLSRIDPLTGLFNRRAFYEIINPIWQNVERHQKDLSMMVLDIDNFKNINDVYGHVYGDKILKKTASTLRKIVRNGDVFARWGGEEFTILLPETDLKKAKFLAERLREQISNLQVEAESIQLNFTISIGVAQKKPNMHNVEDLFKQADRCLYKAKNSGRNKVCSGGDLI